MECKALCHPLFPIHRGRTGWLTKTLLVVNLTGILLLAAVLHVSALGTAQTVTYSAKAAPLAKVFADLEKQTGYVFFYNKQYLQDATPVTVSLRQVALREALEAILANEPVGFEIKGNTIVITRKGKPIKQESETPPPADIHGHITDSLGNPLAGASVTVKGSNKGTTTDAGGNFVLKGIDNNATLVISFTGYETQQIKLNGRNEVAIQLKQAVASLQDVVVNKGYYSVRQRENTGNVSIVSSKEIQEQPVSDPIQALIGRVPGLNIQQTSGIPGAYATIRIRGQNSIVNGNDPLYIIDGVPFSALSLSTGIGVLGGSSGTNYSNGRGLSPFNLLNPSDIESIEVLKDADATAIYGSRGANGVILITTKKGKAGDTRFDLNVFTGVGTVAHKLDLLNTQQYLSMRREAFKNDVLPIPNINTNPSDYNYDINGVWDTTRFTDWQKVIIGNTASFTNLEGNLSGGNANTQFVIGGGYSKQGTVFPGNFSDQKAMAHINLTHSSEDRRFGAQFVINYVNDNNNLPRTNFTSYITLAPDAPALYDKNGNINWQVYNGRTTFNNVEGELLRKANSITNNLISNLNLRYELLPGLEINSAFGYNHDQMNQSLIIPLSSVGPPNNNNPNVRNHTFSTTDFSTWSIEPQISYQKAIGQGRLNVFVGSTFQQNKTSSIIQSADGFTSDALIPDPRAASYISLLGANNVQYRYIAIYGRIGYNWKEKYIVNLTARRDGSSRFGPGKQFGNFGAAGAAWIFSNEKFIQNALPFLSFGKLRASYGTSGNDQIADYQFLSTYSIPTSTSYQGVTGLAPTRLTNPYFAWEVVRKLEGGLELGFLKDRINLSVSYYRNRTGNQLVGLPEPIVTGFLSIQYNLPAVVQNSGVELILNTVNIKKKDFSWTSSINLTIPDNRLIAFPNLASFAAYKNQFVVGKSLFTPKVYQSTGVDPQTGLYSFATKNTNGQPSYPDDLIVGRQLAQQFYGGLQNTFSYKGFALDIFIQYVNQVGHSYQNAFILPGYVNYNQPTAVLGRWQSPGDLTAVQRFGTGSVTYTRSSLFAGSDRGLTDASFLRLKNLEFSYRLLPSWKTKLHLQNARIYLQCQNLFTITHYLGLDPETQGFSLPPLRMITAGLQITF